MTYAKAVLSAVSAIFLTLLGFEFWFIAKEAGNSKATGLAVFGGIGLEALYSPLAWAVALSLFVLFFVTGRLRSKALRILLFWTPVTGTWIFALGIAALITFAWLRLRQGY